MSEEKTDAIQEDVTEKTLTGRDAAMAAILEQTRTPQEDPESLEDEIKTPIELEEEFEILKVDGEEVKRSKNDVLEAGRRSLQKADAADKRLEEATRLQRDAEAKNAELEQRRADLDELERQMNLKAEVTDEDLEEFGKRFEDALFTEDGEAGKVISGIKSEYNKLKKELDELKGNVQRVGTDVATVRGKEQKKEAAEFETATTHFHTAYRDIASDNEKLLLFNNRLNANRAENPGMSLNEIVDKSAKDYYEKFGRSQETPKPSKKDNLLKQPKGGSRRKDPPAVDKPLTMSEKLAEMRAGRGLR